MQFNGLTPKQKNILDFIESFILEREYAPSLDEIAKKFHKTVPTIYQYVETLKNKGYLKKEDNVSRGIHLKEKQRVVFLLGYIAAGEPIEPLENPEPFNVPASMIKSQGSYYALKVKGDSMIDMGILDKDIVLIKHQLNAQNGDVIVAITEKGATLKVFRKRNGKIYLEPKNKKLKNIYPKKLEIRGKFVGLIRN